MPLPESQGCESYKWRLRSRSAPASHSGLRTIGRLRSHPNSKSGLPGQRRLGWRDAAWPDPRGRVTGCFSSTVRVLSLLSSPEYRVDGARGGLAVPHDIAPQIDGLGPAVANRQLRQQRDSPVFGNPRILGTVLPAEILFPPDDDTVGIDVLNVRRWMAKAAAAQRHHFLVVDEAVGKVLFLSGSIERRAQNPHNLPLGVDRRRHAELRVEGTHLGAQILKYAAFPPECMTLTRGHLARSDNGARPVDVFGGRAGSSEGPEIGHHPILPAEGVPLSARRLTPANDDPQIVDRPGLAVASAQRPQAALLSVRRPTQCTHVARTVAAPADDDPVVIDVVRRTFISTHYGAQILHYTGLPHERVASGVRVSTQSAGADDHPGVVDAIGLREWSPKGAQISDSVGGTGRGNAELR